jgi:uncharacterized protein
MNRNPLVLIALTLLFALALPQTGRADDAAKEALVREMMELTGSAELGKQMLEGMMAQFSQNPAIAQEFTDKFLELAKPEELIEMIVPLYVQALDEATLKATIEFYKSPAGKQLVAVQPQLTQDSMVLGQQWGMKLAEATQAALEQDKKRK